MDVGKESGQEREGESAGWLFTRNESVTQWQQLANTALL